MDADSNDACSATAGTWRATTTTPFGRSNSLRRGPGCWPLPRSRRASTCSTWRAAPVSSTLAAARSVGPRGSVLGTDLVRPDGRGRAATRRRTAAVERDVSSAWMRRRSTCPTATFDVVLCSLGLMYLPDPQRARARMAARAEARRPRRHRGLGQARELRLVAGVPDRRCGSRERRVPAVLLAGRAGRAGAAVQRRGLRAPCASGASRRC